MTRQPVLLPEQEAKVPKAKLTKELACVEGYEVREFGQPGDIGMFMFIN